MQTQISGAAVAPFRTREDRHAEAREAMEAAARALMSSEGWLAWARTRSAFHSYSWGNCALIAMQRPDATRVAGYRTWQKLGRQVRKGERGIRILAPMPWTRAEVDEETGEERERRGTAFRAVSVFDISQTDGDPLPAPPDPQPVTGDSHAGLIPWLVAHAQALGYSVAFDSTGGPAHGYCDPAGRRIVVSDALPANGRVKTLIHELAHAHGVNYTTHTRGAAEVIVETVAYIVAGAVGLDTSGYSVPYVAGWGADGDLKAVRECAETVDAIARAIETACGIGSDAGREAA
jgi:hypothetical protein